MEHNLHRLLVVITLLCLPNIIFSQAPDLGVSATFALFTSSGAFNGDAATSVTGDIGTNAGAFSPPGFLIGSIHVADPVSAQAAMDLGLAYGYLAGLTCSSVLTTPLGNGQILAPNIYCIGTAAVLNANLILDAGGNPGAIFIFQIDGALSTNSFSSISLINGANLCNVYWQINGALNVGGNTVFQGTVLAEGAINLANGAVLRGRGLSTAGAISTNANSVTLPNACLCELDVTCPNPSGGTFQCSSNIPAGLAADVTVNSACGTASVAITATTTGAGCAASPYVLTRTYTVTDQGGNSTACVVTYTAIDLIPPMATCPATVVISCASNVPTAAPNSVTTSDNCGGGVSVVSLGDAITGSVCANRFTITRTYRATDLCGNSTTCSQTITVNDVTPPTLTCPANVVVSCAPDVPPPAPAAIVTSDNCGGAVTVIHVGDVTTPGICANRFTVTRTYRATDLCGNSTTCAQMITVNDVTLPIITCPANVVVSCAPDVPPPAPATIVTSDNCGGAVTVIHVGDVTTTGICANRFTITRTYRATDLCGNSATCAQMITVNDVTLPIITCPANVVVSCAPDVPPPAPASIVSSDNCGSVVTVIHVGDVITPGTCANRFTITRTYRATDLCGNSATCAQMITVNDVTLPTLTCPVNVVVSCAPDVPPPAPATIVTSDNCGGAVTVIHVGDATTPGICANRFTVTRTYRATDLCGNSATCAQTITVNDITPPTFLNPPANFTVECNQVPPAPPLPTALDNCTGPVTVVLLSAIQTPGICPILYTLTRTWRASDACGNSASISQVMTVTDTYAPQFVDVPADIVIDCDLATNEAAFQDWLANFGGATIFDCTQITWTTMPSPIFTMPSTCGGTSQRFIRFTATDACGNSSFKDASFTIMDMTPPSFDVLPQNLIIECVAGDEGESQFIDWFDNFGYAEVSDKCGSVVTAMVLLSDIQNCGNTFTRTYQFRATDECGNTNYVTATFAIVDTTPPVITECPQSNVLLTCKLDVPAPDTTAVIAWDACGGPLQVTLQSELTVGIGCAYWPLTKSYTYAVSDLCGNVSTCIQSFQVVDSIPPVYTGPDTLTVICVSDLPGIAEVAGVLTPYFVDNCYQIICVNEGVTETGATWITFCIKAKDLCVNWTEKFKITFVATGGCKPLCTINQSGWGDASASINNMPTTEAFTGLVHKYGPVTAGGLNKTIKVSSPDCLQNMLPGSGNTNQFSPGQFEFGEANECQLASSLLNADGSLKNKLAANVLAMQLNIWYNREYNERDLGVQALALLPACLVDLAVMARLEADNHSVQGLLNLSNDYLAGLGAFPPNFGAPLSHSLENLNNYWKNCQTNDPCSTTVSVAGKLKTESLDGFEHGQVKLDGSNTAGQMASVVVQTDVAGFYEFPDAVPALGNYTVTPSSEDLNYLNGVTTYDLMLISKHILGIEALNSPYKMIAADANKSGSITTFDVVTLRKLILGITEELPDNTTWRFIDKSFAFSDAANPFANPFPEHKTLESIQTSQMESDFVTVKVGDVNGSALANGLMQSNERTTGTLFFDLDDRPVQAGEVFEFKMTADQKIQCYQFTLLTDGLEVLDISGEKMAADNFAVFAADGIHASQPGALTTSWNMTEGGSESFAEFTVKCRAIRSGKLGDMLRVSSQITKAEANKVSSNNAPAAALSIALRFHDAGGLSIRGLGFELYQNIPNPFFDKTVIGFYLPEAAPATLTIYDETGRLVFSQKGDFAQGYSAFVLDRQLLKTNGSMLYKLETPTDVAVKKMIQTK